MDPPSEANKVSFWLKTNMGVIVCCVCFIPFIIYVLFINKDSDPKLKKVAAIAAAVALALGVGLSADWNPVSQEGLATATETLSGQEVYFTQFGSVYHVDPECQHIRNSSNVLQGTIDEAVAGGKTRMCKTCANNYGYVIDDNGAILTAPDREIVEDAVDETVEDLEEFVEDEAA